MWYLALLKMLYLADRQALIETGRPITGDRLVALDLGPVVSRTYTLISLGSMPDSGGDDWYEYVSEARGKKVEGVKADPEKDELSDYEIEVLDDIYDNYGAWDRWALSEWTHTLPEWRDPHGSSLPINPEDILRSVGKSSDEIARIADDAEENLFIRTFVVGA